MSFVENVLSSVQPNTTEVLLGVVVLCIAYFISGSVRRAFGHFPPGPRGLPIVGYLPFISRDAHFHLLELGKKYGDVFSVQMGSETVVVLHSVEAIKEALGKPEFLGRPPEGPLKLYNENSAFFVGDVHKWKEQRRFVVQSMKDLGLGRTQIEGEIMDEIRHFLDILRSHQGRPMDLKEPLSPSMSNNICTLVFGKRYQYEDPDRIYLDSNMETGNEGFSMTSAYAFFPWLLKVPLFTRIFGVKEAMAAFGNLDTFFRKEIKKHKDTFDAKNIRDFIDSYIVEMESRKKKDPNTTFSDDLLVSNVMDLFSAGSETVRTSILWHVYTAAAFPEVQTRIRQEILEVMGPDRDPDFQDLKQMPYTHSFLLEVMRWKTIVPLNVLRITLADTTVCGYDIPKNTIVLSNLWNAHHDPKYWTEPEKLIPERFINKDGHSVSRPSHFMPFSMGKRVCPGEPMAIMEMFLYFTSILQKFQVVFPEGEGEPKFQATLKGTYRLDAYKVRFLERS